jgi:hypothetical protein
MLPPHISGSPPPIFNVTPAGRLFVVPTGTAGCFRNVAIDEPIMVP